MGRSFSHYLVDIKGSREEGRRKGRKEEEKGYFGRDFGCFEGGQ